MLDSTTKNKVDKLLGLLRIYRTLEDKQLKKCLGDVMRFDTPLVWLSYKHAAYQDSVHAINTVGDLRAHCDAPDDICAKRFHFIAPVLHDLGDETVIDTLFVDEAVTTKLKNSELVGDWKKYEFFEQEGVICKWQNYGAKLGVI